VVLTILVRTAIVTLQLLSLRLKSLALGSVVGIVVVVQHAMVCTFRSLGIVGFVFTLVRRNNLSCLFISIELFRSFDPKDDLIN